MKCDHYDGRGCSLGLYGGNPSPGVCSTCDQYQGRPRGAGDIVHAIAKTLRLDKLTEGRDCGCAERRKRWNHAKKKSENER